MGVFIKMYICTQRPIRVVPISISGYLLWREMCSGDSLEVWGYQTLGRIADLSLSSFRSVFINARAGFITCKCFLGQCGQGVSPNNHPRVYRNPRRRAVYGRCHWRKYSHRQREVQSVSFGVRYYRAGHTIYTTQPSLDITYSATAFCEPLMFRSLIVCFSRYTW